MRRSAFQIYDEFDQEIYDYLTIIEDKLEQARSIFHQADGDLTNVLHEIGAAFRDAGGREDFVDEISDNDRLMEGPYIDQDAVLRAIDLCKSVLEIMEEMVISQNPDW